MCHYLTSNRQFSLLAAPLPLSAVPPPQSAESSRLWVFYYCELPKYFYISTELFFGTNLFSVYWHGHGGQGDSKPSQVRLWKRDKWGCWGRSYSSYTQNVCYNWLYKWYNQTRWHHKTYVSHFLKKKNSAHEYLRVCPTIMFVVIKMGYIIIRKTNYCEYCCIRFAIYSNIVYV